MYHKKILAIGVLIFLINGSLPFFGSSEEEINGAEPLKNQYEPHNPIRINNYSEFTPENGVTGGNGTAENPYIIEGWEIDGGEYTYCIYIGNTTCHFEIRNCRLYNSSNDGLILFNVTNGTINNTLISENIRYGIYLENATNITINYSSITSSMKGIKFFKSTNNVLYHNQIYSNTQEGILLFSSRHNNIFNNIIRSNSWDGISLSSSTNNLLENNTVIDNAYDGIFINNSTHNTLKNNTVSENIVGILLKKSNHNHIENNSLKLNKKPSIIFPYPSGLIIQQSNNNTVNNSYITNNSFGIFILSSYDNLIYNNYFDNIWKNAVDKDGYNRWNISNITGKNIIGGNYIAGNYWTDYEGRDRDGDGLGDEKLPYNCEGKIKNGGDQSPLVPKNYAPIANFTFKTERDGLTVRFTDTSYDPDGKINRRIWDFGDGKKSQEENPIHKYQKRKNYTITLTVEDNNRTISSITKSVDLSKRPYVEIKIRLGKMSLPRKMPIFSILYEKITGRPIDTIGICNITFEVETSGVAQVDFYWFEKKLYSDTEPPFEFTFKPPFGENHIWVMGKTIKGYNVRDDLRLLSLNIP